MTLKAAISLFNFNYSKTDKRNNSTETVLLIKKSLIIQTTNTATENALNGCTGTTTRTL